jgi:calcium-binding protein CML
MLHQSLSADRRVELTQAFGQFDVDGDGNITADELKRVLAALRVEVSEEEVSRMMRAADLDGNGTVDLDEFLAVNARAEHQLAGDVEKELLHEAFRVFDEDANGYISAEELYRVLTSLSGGSHQPTMEECKNMICSVDADGDGLVDFGEFEKMMMVQLPVS